MKRSKKCICKFGKPNSEGTMRWWPNKKCLVHKEQSFFAQALGASRIACLSSRKSSGPLDWIELAKQQQSLLTKQKTKKYALKELPVELMKDIINTATRVAGWTSPKKKGKGSTMLMEWVTFPYTLKEWKNRLGWCKEIDKAIRRR